MFYCRSQCPSAVSVDFRAFRNAFGAGLTLGVCRRQPPASCRRLCAAAEGARGRGRRVQGRSRGRSCGQVRGGPSRAQRCCRPVGTRLPSASPRAAKAVAAGWGRPGSLGGRGRECRLLRGCGPWGDPVRAAGRCPRDGPCGVWVGTLVRAAPGTHRGHLQAGWAGLPSPRLRSVCGAGTGRAAIHGVTTRSPRAVLKGHGNAVGQC